MSDQTHNRRKHVRVYRHFILTYSPVSNSTKRIEVSQINNISQGGLSFSVTEPIEMGTILAIELKTPFLAESLYLQGEVLQCRDKISQLIYEVRVQFKDLSTQAKDVLFKIEQYAHKEEA